jgi:hypothetical protein
VESLRTKIEEALKKIELHRRPADFQRLAFHLASLSWSDLRATTLGSDLGADALIPFRDGKTKLVLACGINGDLTKLKEDCKRLQDTHRKPEEIVFATTLPVTEISEQKWREVIRKEFGIGLREVMQREWITSELEKAPNRWLCKEYLEIPLAEFENLSEILPRIRRAAAKLLDAWKDERQFESHPLIDLALEEYGTGTTAVRLSDIPPRLSAGDRCWLTGAPGAGKTFFLITIASALIETDLLIPVLVSLRDLSHRGDKLLDWIASEPSFQEQGISEAELANAASAGKLLILLNGWNEIARNTWMATVGTIKSFVRQMPGSAVLVASRQPPDRDFKFSAREFRIRPLSGNEIRKAIRQARLDDADRHADLILASNALFEIAAVPLFLQAMIQEMKANNKLPLGKQAMLRRMIERAVEEHRSALEHGDVRQHAFRYLRNLAWDTTGAGSTTLPDREARLAISNTVSELKQEALLGEAPAPPEILEQLRAGHLLVSGSDGDVAFTHQLIQEHFAATGITSVLGEAINGNLVFPRESLTDYQWEQPLFLALEDLAEENRTAEIRIVLDWFRFVDFEAACRMAGVVSDFWPEIRDLFEPVIRHLARLENVNARWLAARCAAATGQAEFQDLVWAALEGHPKGSSDCFEGISPTFLLRALGEGFVEKLLQVPEEEFRLRALALAGQSPSVESLCLSEILAIRDPAPTVRRLAFRQLFISGRSGWLRRFLQDVQGEGWSLDALRVLNASPRCTTGRFRKFIGHYLERQTTIKERMNTLTVWEREDAPGASARARAEYDRLEIAASLSEGDWEFRQFCLKLGASDGLQWAIPRLVREAMSPDGVSRPNVPPLNILPDTERTIVVKALLPELAMGGHTTMGVRRHVSELAPVVAALVLLRAIVKGARESAPAEDQRNLRQALHEISHAAVVEAVLHTDFAEPSHVELGPLLHAVSIGSPGGDPQAVRLLPEEDLIAYRQRLLHWLSLLPPLDENSAFDWATCSTLIGEVGHPDDAERLYKILCADEERLRGQIERIRLAVDDYTSGRTATPPGPIGHMSYANWHIVALANIPGQRCMEMMLELLLRLPYIGVAAHVLAQDAGADPMAVSGGIANNPRFDLIYERRSARKPLAGRASRYDAAIKKAIDLHLTQHQDNRSPALLSALCAVARIAEPNSESWILEKLERYFPGARSEDLLEYITLAGGLLPGHRILPFVRNTINFALSEPWSNYDKTFLVTKALVSLFFTDAPGLAIEILEGEASWFLGSYQFHTLLGMLAWERSEVVGAWLEQLLSREFQHSDTREAIFKCLVQRARHNKNSAAIVALANRIVRAGPDLMQNYSSRRMICEIASADEDLCSQLLSRGRSAQSIYEAAGWLHFLSEIGTVEGMRVAFEFADRFGEQLRVVTSLSPNTQEGTSLSFQGWFARQSMQGKALYHRFPDIIAKLYDFAASSDRAMNAAAERALLWIERGRILGGAPPSGQRTVPPESKIASDDRPWQLRLHYPS